MNSDNLSQLMQQGFRITLGATASLVETLQNPQKRSDNLDSIRSELNHLTTEWASKGEITEQEARDFVNNLLTQMNHQGNSSTSSTQSNPVSNTPTQTVPSSVELEVQELTVQLAAIRAELEKLRNSDSNPS